MVDVKSTEIETADAIARALERAETLLGAGRVRYVHPDCGVWMLSRNIADGKIRAWSPDAIFMRDAAARALPERLQARSGQTKILDFRSVFDYALPATSLESGTSMRLIGSYTAAANAVRSFNRPASDWLRASVNSSQASKPELGLGTKPE